MADREELTLTLYGLDAFNGDVDGEVFSRKFFKFMQGLSVADAATNGTRSLHYLISDLNKNTATAKVREQTARVGVEIKSGIAYYADGVKHIYEDSVVARTLPREFVKYVLDVAKDAGNSFARGEIKRNDNVIAIDAFLESRARGVLADINRAKSGAVPFYQGTAHGSFDGTLLLLDALKGANRAVLVLTAGGRNIECDISLVPSEKAAAAFKRRCVVIGTAQYDGVSPLPIKITATDIEPVEAGEGLTRWVGAFERGSDEEDDWIES